MMKKKTALTLLFCAVAVVILTIAIMAGMSKQKQQELQQQQQQQEQQEQLNREQEEQLEQQKIAAYRDKLEDTFDTLLENETDLQQAMESDNQRETFMNMIESTGDIIEQLSAMETPETLAGAQEHFISAADSYSEMADQAIQVLSDETQDSNALAVSILELLPDAVQAFDEIQSGIDELEANGVDVPDSAKQFSGTLSSILNGNSEVTP